jgi:hypothetical protein
MGPLSLGELVPAGGEDLDRFLVKAHQKSLLLELCEALENRVGRVTVLAEPFAEREGGEVGRVDKHAEGEGVEPAPSHGRAQQALGQVVGQWGAPLKAWIGSWRGEEAHCLT